MVVTYLVDLPLIHCKHENEVVRSYWIGDLDWEVIQRKKHPG
jgi:hypothetical protein